MKGRQLRFKNQGWLALVLFGALVGCQNGGGGGFDQGTPDLGGGANADMAFNADMASTFDMAATAPTGDLASTADMAPTSDLLSVGDLASTGDLTMTMPDMVVTGSLTVLAGQIGKAGSTDGTGSVALFQGPTGVASDGAGTLYVADHDNYTIRKIVISTGSVTTLAGMAGTAGSADGIGAAARFNYPNDIASDGAGNLYVADASNDTIRKIVIATGAVTTLAGMALTAGNADGTGAAARF
jgi:hypothetical protein